MMNSSPYRTLQTVTLTIAVLGILLLALGGYLNPLLRVTLEPLIVSQTWLSSRYGALRDVLAAPQDMALLRMRNQELEAEVARLQTQVIDLQQQLEQTRILTALLDFARTSPENRYVAASVIGRDPSPFLHYVLINRGSDHGLRRGMPVVTSQGLVGRVAAVTPGAARVQLITDPSSVVNVRLEPSTADAVLNGSMTGDLTLDQIPQDLEIRPGDLVLTSGLGGNYPANVLIGQVTGVRSRATDLFQRASVQPAVDFNELEVVLVISTFRAVDTGPLIPYTTP